MPASAVPARADGAFRLTVGADGKVAAEGPLTFATARDAREAGLHTLAGCGAGECEVDCSGITQSDSAGLAVLLDWLAAARRAGHKLHYARLPESLVALGRISELEELLERGV